MSGVMPAPARIMALSPALSTIFLMVSRPSGADAAPPEVRINYLFVLTAPLYIIHLSMVWKRQDKALDPALPILVMSSFLFAILMGFGFVRFLL